MLIVLTIKNGTVQCYFAIPAHNAPVETVFFLLNFQWTDEQNKLTDKVVNVLHHMRNVTCTVLKKISLKHVQGSKNL